MIQSVSAKGIIRLTYIIFIFIFIFIIGSTALSGTWPPQTNVASDLYSGHPPANF
jgi:hypothetical protein